jgi:hypothetical protein
MRCIGVNQWVGVDPFDMPFIVELDALAAKTERAEGESRSRNSPSERFVASVGERFQKPKILGIVPVKGYWKIGESTLAEFTDFSLSDVRDARRFLVQLQSLYVVDTARGQGEGAQAITQIKAIADETGCGVALFASAFAFSKDGILPNAMQSFEELWKAAMEEKWPIIYLPEWEGGDPRLFYERCGFQNMCLYDSWVYQRPKEEDLPFERQFVYLPPSMNPTWRSQIEHRLNRDLCAFCNR